MAYWRKNQPETREKSEKKIQNQNKNQLVGRARANQSILKRLRLHYVFKNLFDSPLLPQTRNMTAQASLL